MNELVNIIYNIDAIIKSGLYYTNNDFDIIRYLELQKLSQKLLKTCVNAPDDFFDSILDSPPGYQTPKIDVRGVIISDNKILLVREKSDGLWAIPGGWADINLTLKQNVEREVYEEAGLQVYAERLIAIQDRNKHNTVQDPFTIYKIFLSCTIVGGEFLENNETHEYGFFSKDCLPDLSEIRTTLEQVKLCFSIIHDNREIYFD